MLSLADKIEGKEKPKRTRKKEESKPDPDVEEKDESIFNEESKEIEFELESTILLKEIEDPASVLIDSLTALIAYEKKVGADAFNEEITEALEITNTISIFVYSLLSIIEGAINILPEPQD